MRKKISGLFPLILLGLLLTAFTAYLLVYMVPVTGGTDQNGYHVCAKMLETTGKFFQKPVDDLQFIGSMWVVNGRGEFYPKYPPFYPALAAGMTKLLGDGGGFYASLWGAVFSVAGMFLLGRILLGPWWGLLCAFLTASSPLIAGLAITKNSHTPSLAFFVWGMAFFLYAAANPKKIFLIFAFLGGILIGYTVGIRYTDFLLILPPIAYSLFLLRGGRRWRMLFALGLGAAIPYALLAWFHGQAYGAPWRSGYSLTSESTAFELKFIWTNLQIYFPEFFVNVIGPAGAFALIVWKFRWRRALFWGSWLLPTFCLYLTYYWAPEASTTGTMRFLTPLIPAVVLLAVFSLRKIAFFQNGKILAGGTLVLLIALQGIWGWTQGTRICEPKFVSDIQNRLAVDFVKENVPEKSIVMAPTGLLNELDYEKKWTLYGSYLLSPYSISQMVERSLGAQAAGLQKVRAVQLRDKLGKMRHGELHQFLRNFFEQQQKNGHDVYFVGRTWETNNFRRIYFRWFDVQKVASLTPYRKPWLIRNTRPEASRYRGKKDSIAISPYEIVKLGPKRERYLTNPESIALLQTERNEISARLNPERNAVVSSDLTRLEALKDEISSLYRAESTRKANLKRQTELKKKRAEDARRNAEIKKKNLEKQKAEKKKKAELMKQNELRRKTEEKKQAELRRKIEEKHRTSLLRLADAERKAVEAKKKMELAERKIFIAERKMSDAERKMSDAERKMSDAERKMNLAELKLLEKKP